MARFQDKSVIVTGSSGGIGRSAAIAFAREGARVVLADIKTAENAETLEMITSQGGTAIALDVNVTNQAQVKNMVDIAVEEFGGVDIGVNNAGIFPDVKLIHEQDDETYQRTMDINVRGVWLCMKYQLRQMLKQGRGAIANTASSKTVVAGTPGGAFYSASKCAVVGLTRSAALEYASAGIRINAIGPGATMTPILENLARENPGYFDDGTEAAPIGFIADPADMASAILYLSSDEARYVVGQNFMVDGGVSIT